MSNMIGILTVVISVVIAGVLVWWVSKQHQRKEHRQRKQAEHHLRTQLEQERLQREQIDFASKLYEYLKSGKWEEADEETLEIMLRLAGREKEGWLDVASIQNFPRGELRAIDQLWEKSSNGHFGFSIQKRIWESIGGNLDADDQIRQAFGDRVGWRVNKKWLQVDDLSFKPSAPVGHLPAVAVRLGGLSWGVDGFWWDKRKAYEFLLSQKDW